jgi:peptide/nickel transport system substrate-binding protein
MQLKPFRKKLRKNITVSQKQVKEHAVKAEKGFEKYFLHRIGRLENVGRFVTGWLALMLLLIGGVIGQNIMLSNYYQTVKAVPGGIFKEGLVGTFTNANPVYAVSEADSIVSELIFAGLFKYNQDGMMVGDLAESYTVDGQGSAYTVKLKPNLKWHDGKPLTSADVVYTYQTIQNPDVGSPLRSSWQGVKVSAPDAQTVVFRLPTPLASFIYGLSTGIIPQHILKDVPAEEFRSIDFNTLRPVGSGPFAWKAIEATGSDTSNSEQQVALSKYEGYHDGAPKLQEFVVHTYKDKAQLIKGIKSQELTAVSGLLEVPSELKNRDAVEEHSLLLRAATMVFFKNTGSVLADKSVRSSLVFATDTEAIRKSLGYETRDVRSPFLTGQTGYDPKQTQSRYDLSAAKKALDSAGWIVQNDGIRAKAGVRLSFAVTAQDTPEYKRVSKLLKDQWRDAGIDAKVNILDSKEFQMSLSSHSYEALLYGITIGVDPDVFVYWNSTQADIRSDNRLNLSEYKNATADRALESGRSRIDPSLRAVKYAPFLKAWIQDVPALGLYQPRYLYVSNGPIDGLAESPITNPLDRFTNVHNWQIRQAKVTNP